MNRIGTGHPRPPAPRWTRASALFSVTAAPLFALLACSKSANQNGFTSSSTGEQGRSGVGGAGDAGEGGALFVGSGGDSLTLKITPNAPILKVEVPLNGNPTVQLNCVDTKTNLPVVNPTWKLDT